MESSSEHNRNLSTIFGFVSEEIQRAPDGLPGSKIGLLLRHRVPGFRPIEFGFKNLKELLLSSADPGFCVVGHVLGKRVVTSCMGYGNQGQSRHRWQLRMWEVKYRVYRRRTGELFRHLTQRSGYTFGRMVL